MRPNIVIVQPKIGDMDMFLDNPTPPLGLLCAVSLVCRDMDVRIIDQRTEPDWRAALAAAIDARTAAVGITCNVGGIIIKALEAAREVRRLTAAPIVWGGVGPSVIPEQIAAHELVDYLVEGEGEVAFADLMRAIVSGADTGAIPGIWRKKDGKVAGVPRAALLDLNALPMAPYHLVDMHRYMQSYLGEPMFSYQSSRGCPNVCGYCYNAVFNLGRWRGLSAERVIKELKELKERYGFSLVYFLDDSFFVDQARAFRIFAGLKELGLGSVLQGVCTETLARMSDADMDFLEGAGLRRISVGVDSGCDRIRSEIIKKKGDVRHVREQLARFRGRKIIFSCPMMIGLPTETRAEMMMTVDLAFEILKMGANFRVPQLLIYTPCPGTALYSMLERSGVRFPSKLEDWAGYEVDFSRIHDAAPEHKELLESISFLSKFLDRKMEDYNISSALVKIFYYTYQLIAKVRMKTGFVRPLPERAIYKFIKKRGVKN